MTIKIPASSLTKFKSPLLPATPPEFDSLLESASIDLELPLGVAARLEKLLNENDRLLELIEELDVDDRTCFAALLASIAESLPAIVGRNLSEIRPERCDLESILEFRLDRIETEEEKNAAVAALREYLPSYDDIFFVTDRGTGTMAQSFRFQLDNGAGWEQAEVKLTSIPWRKLQSMSLFEVLGEVGCYLGSH